MQTQRLTRLKKWCECSLAVAVLSLAANITNAANITTAGEPTSDGTECTHRDGISAPGFCNETNPKGQPVTVPEEDTN